jgi:hypothetical protein
MNPDETLLEALLMAGIIQFGYFIDEQRGEPAPFRLQFELLPAYPRLLDQAADVVAGPLKPMDLHRLVCDQHSLALAVCVSQKLDIPLVYNQGNGIVGAYDVGHPAALIANVYSVDVVETLATVKSRAERTGLKLVSEIYAIGLSRPKSPTAQCVISINEDLLERWVSQRWITAHQQLVIAEWLQQQTLTRHPG